MKSSFKLTKQQTIQILKDYNSILRRVSEVVDEIGFLTTEYDSLEIEKTEFNGNDVIVTAYDSHYDCYDSITGRFPMEFLFESKEKHEDWYVKKRKIQEEKRVKK